MTWLIRLITKRSHCKAAEAQQHRQSSTYGALCRIGFIITPGVDISADKIGDEFLNGKLPYDECSTYRNSFIVFLVRTHRTNWVVRIGEQLSVHAQAVSVESLQCIGSYLCQRGISVDSDSELLHRSPNIEYCK